MAQLAGAALQVVVIEPDWLTRRAVEKTLELSGAEVTSLPSEGAVRAHIECCHVDLALISVLPSVAVAAQQAKTIHLGTAAAIVYMADAWSESFDDLVDPGPAGFLIKPYQEAQFTAIVSVAIRYRRPSEPPRMSRAGPESSAPASADETVDVARRETAVALAAGLGARTESNQRVTTRELQVIHLLMAGGRVRTISDDLSLSPHTVRNHLKSVYKKLGVHSQSDLIIRLTESHRARAFPRPIEDAS